MNHKLITISEHCRYEGFKDNILLVEIIDTIRTGQRMRYCHDDLEFYHICYKFNNRLGEFVIVIVYSEENYEVGITTYLVYDLDRYLKRQKARSDANLRKKNDSDSAA